MKERMVGSLDQYLKQYFSVQQTATTKSSYRRVKPSQVTTNSARAATSSYPILVIAGDLEAGSEISSEGDICVTGRLSGGAHAGSSGDRTALIRAQGIDSDRVTIAGVKADRRLSLDGPTLVVCEDNSLKLWPQKENKRSSSNNKILSCKEASFGHRSLDVSRIGGGNLSKEALLKASWPARAALVTGLYILIAGSALLLAPLKTFTVLFDQRSVAPVWIRVGGVLAMLFGIYYLGAAHGDVTGRGLTSFYRATILGRSFLFVVFSFLVITKKSQWQLLILAAVNLYGAISMQRALAKQATV